MPGPVNPWLWVGFIVFVIALITWKGVVRNDEEIAQERAVLQKQVDDYLSAKEEQRQLFLKQQERALGR